MTSGRSSGERFAVLGPPPLENISFVVSLEERKREDGKKEEMESENRENEVMRMEGMEQMKERRRKMFS